VPARPASKPPLPNSALARGESKPEIQPKPARGLKTISFLNHSESLTFEIFRSRTVPEMAGVRSRGFWHNVVLPACYDEPAVLHACMALTIACRWLLTPVCKSGSSQEEVVRLDTVNQYNKAIQHLKAHVTGLDNLSSLRLTLITCVLFIALELCTGQILPAMMHLNEGRKLLHSCVDLDKPGVTDGEPKPLVLSSRPQSVEEELVAVFADLDLQSTYFGSARPQLKLTAHETRRDPRPSPGVEPLFSFALPVEFGSIQEADQQLTLLANRCLEFVGDRLEPDRQSLRNAASNFHRQHLCTLLQRWRQTHDRFCRRVGDAATSQGSWKQQWASMLVRHAWLNLGVSLSYWELDESDLDAYLPAFTTIVALSSGVVLPETTRKGRFSLESGVVAPLWFTVMKCRHPRIRRQALHLLRLAPREGLWDPDLAAQLAREAIRLEEGLDTLDEDGLRWDTPIHREDDDAGQVVPSHRRIATAEMEWADGEDPVLVMTFRRTACASDGNRPNTETIVVTRPYETHQTLS